VRVNRGIFHTVRFGSLKARGSEKGSLSFGLRYSGALPYYYTQIKQYGLTGSGD
jgi:hypothetical protein